jgi:hypothetical protein
VSSRLALVLAAVAAAAALIAALPNLGRSHWIVGLALRETSLLVTLVAAVAAALAMGHADPEARLARLLALPAACWGLVAFAAPLTAFPCPRRFSMREYLLGPLAVPQVTVRHDVDLGGPLRADV